MQRNNLNSQDEIARLRKLLSNFAPTKLKVPIDQLKNSDKAALAKMIAAANIMNEIYMKQLWKDNQKKFAELQKSLSELDRVRLHYYWLNKGPWSDLDHKKFLPDVPEEKPIGANFYPEDITKMEFESWLQTLSKEQQERAKSFFTVIERKANGLEIKPYNEVYQEELIRAADLLNEAAQLTSNASLKTYLEKRAQAFLSNDYYESDIAWMDLNSPMEITIGPYETYQDELLNYKAAFQAEVNLPDDDATKKIEIFGKYLQEIENNLPIPNQYKNPKLGAMSPMRVVNQIFTAGDAAHGPLPAAYNLPNDDRVIHEKGSKKVLLKNIMEAKFNNASAPIAKLVLDEVSLKNLSFDAYFIHVLAHELTHGIGPHEITINGRKTTVRKELKELYSAIEEAKADMTGLFALQYLINKQNAGKIPKDTVSVSEAQLYITFFALIFRGLRFGTTEAHGLGTAMQLNYFLEKGAITFNEKTGQFALVLDKIASAIEALTHDLLMIEATGNYNAAQQLLKTYGSVSPAVQNILDKAVNIPIDIEPIYSTAKKLVPSIIKSGAEFEHHVVQQFGVFAKNEETNKPETKEQELRFAPSLN